MTQLLDQLKSDEPCLIVSIPTNTVEAALAAQDGGADAVKVHCNVTHHATGVTFGTLDEEEPRLRAILEAIDIPAGLVPGETLDLDVGYFEKARDMGFTTMDAYAQFWPAIVYKVEGLELAAAFDSSYSWEEMRALDSLPWVDIVEPSVVPVEEYGRLLSLRDVAAYRALIEMLDKPVIIPTQRRIRTDDIPALLSVGAKNLMIGAVVTGKKPEDVERVTREFRQALDAG